MNRPTAKTNVRDIKPGDPVPAPLKPRSEKDLKESWRGDPNKPLASIICPTYNHEDYIQSALDGFLSQRTTFPFEILVHDDASADRTGEILLKYANKYPSIVKPIIQSENQMSQGFRPQSIVFPKAKGEYIAFCEGDDYWIDEDKLQKQVTFLEKNREYVITYTDSLPFSDTKILAINFGGATRDLSADELMHAPSIFTLTSCFRNVLDYPPELSIAKYGDRFIWSRLGRHGKGKFMSDILPSCYRVHDAGIHSSTTAEMRSAMNIQTFCAMYSYYKRCKIPELEHYFRRKLEGYVFEINGVHPKLVPFGRVVTNVVSPCIRGLRMVKKMLSNKLNL